MQSEVFGGLGRRHQSRIAAIAAAEKPDPLPIGDTVGDSPIDSIDQIVMHAPAPFVIGGRDKSLSEPRRASVIDAEHCIAAASQPLVGRAKAPIITGIRAAMYQQHEREVGRPRLR